MKSYICIAVEVLTDFLKFFYSYKPIPNFIVFTYVLVSMNYEVFSMSQESCNKKKLYGFYIILGTYFHLVLVLSAVDRFWP